MRPALFLAHKDASYMLKLDRALEHLYALQAAAQSFIERDPCAVLMECDVKTKEHVLRLRVFEQPPAQFAILAGDCLHNLRQALDHIAYQLAVVVSQSDPPPNERTAAFPIQNSPESFSSNLKKKIGAPGKIPDDMRAILEALQPYKGANGARLGTLRDLDDHDKHRLPPVLVSVGSTPTFNIGELNVNSLTGPRLGPLEDGAEVLRFGLVPDTNMNMSFEFTHGVAFARESPGRGEDVVKLLWAIRETVLYAVIRPLDPFLAA